MKKISRIKLHRIIFLIILLAGNTFAWFIYTSKIDGRIDVHVKAWDVVFESNETQIASNVVIQVSDLFPGMDNYSHSITAYNKSEVSASLTYKLLEARILEDEYITVDGRVERGEEPVATDLTSAQLISKLANDYPFTISFAVSNNIIQADNGASQYTISVVWPYENNHDALDTQWGMAANSFKGSYPTTSSIELKIKIFITQNMDTPNHSSSPSSSSGQAPSSTPAPSSE